MISDSDNLHKDLFQFILNDCHGCHGSNIHALSVWFCHFVSFCHFVLFSQRLLLKPSAEQLSSSTPSPETVQISGLKCERHTRQAQDENKIKSNNLT